MNTEYYRVCEYCGHEWLVYDGKKFGLSCPSCGENLPNDEIRKIKKQVSEVKREQKVRGRVDAFNNKSANFYEKAISAGNTAILFLRGAWILCAIVLGCMSLIGCSPSQTYDNMTAYREKVECLSDNTNKEIERFKEIKQNLQKSAALLETVYRMRLMQLFENVDDIVEKSGKRWNMVKDNQTYFSGKFQDISTNMEENIRFTFEHPKQLHMPKRDE